MGYYVCDAELESWRKKELTLDEVKQILKKMIEHEKKDIDKILFTHHSSYQCGEFEGRLSGFEAALDLVNKVVIK